MSRASFKRTPLPELTRRYDRIAPWYRWLEFSVLFPHRMRKKAVARLELAPGATVLEIGCGTGRSLPLLCHAVGEHGHVIGVDASAGALAQAQRWVDRHPRANVRLIHQDAAQLELERRADAVLFSLSYSVLPDRAPVLQRAWDALAPSGALVIVDAGLLNGVGRLLRPFGEVVATLFPGDPYSQPWLDLRSLSPDVETEWHRLGIYFICKTRKPADTIGPSNGPAVDHA